MTTDSKAEKPDNGDNTGKTAGSPSNTRSSVPKSRSSGKRPALKPLLVPAIAILALVLTVAVGGGVFVMFDDSERKRTELEADLRQLHKALEDQIRETQESIAERVTDSNRIGALESDVSNRLDGLTGVVERVDVVQESYARLVERIAQIEVQIDGLNAVVSTLDDIDASFTQADLGDVRDSATRASNRLSSLATEFDALQQTVAGLSQRMDLQSGGDVVGDAGASYVLGLFQLREAVHSGDPFDRELALVLTLIPEKTAVSENLDTLSLHAESGISTLEDLGIRFRQDAQSAIAEDLEVNAETWIDKSLAMLVGLVSVRRIDGVTTDSDIYSVVGRIADAIDSDDLQGALSETGMLSDVARGALGDWIKMVQTRLDVLSAIEQLHAHALLLAARTEQ